MSVREKIAEDIVDTLKAITQPIAIKYVTREPFDFEKLSNAQYPAVLEVPMRIEKILLLAVHCHRVWQRLTISLYVMLKAVKLTLLETI